VGPPTYGPLSLTNWYPTKYNTQAYSYMEQLPTLDPTIPLETNEMRITFMGSGFPMARRAQAEMSVFVEVGYDTNGLPLDQFIFDIGCGSSENYQSVGIDYARMNKISSTICTRTTSATSSMFTASATGATARHRSTSGATVIPA